MQIQKLFDQALEKPKFHGPKFNTDTLLDMRKTKFATCMAINCMSLLDFPLKLIMLKSYFHTM